MPLPAFAAERRAATLCCWAPAIVDRYLRPTRRSATNPPLLTIDGADRRMDAGSVDRWARTKSTAVGLCCFPEKKREIYFWMFLIKMSQQTPTVESIQINESFMVTYFLANS